MRSKPTSTEKRIGRLNKRVDREVYIFPKKHDESLNRLVKKARRQKPKTRKQVENEWKEFAEKTK